MLKTIVEPIEEFVGAPITAIISFPTLPGLYQEDIFDAALFIGLHVLHTDSGFQLHELVAGYAGHGFGLCEHYLDQRACEKEEEKLLEHHTILVEYTETALLLHGRLMDRAVELPDVDGETKTFFEVGKGCDVYYFVLEFLEYVYAH